MPDRDEASILGGSAQVERRFGETFSAGSEADDGGWRSHCRVGALSAAQTTNPSPRPRLMGSAEPRIE